MLARVRWNNVVLAVVVAGVVGLVVGWPLLGSGEVELPPPVAAVKPPAPLAPTPTAPPRPAARASRAQASRSAAAAAGREAGREGQVRREKVRAPGAGGPAVTAAPTVVATAVTPPAPAVVVAPPAAPATAREFDGFER